ncbi:MAG: hypothetical protein H6700_01035 [Myxococcales bacterium]|nr:hypothetical protein [Myxococcales bacterium]
MQRAPARPLDLRPWRLRLPVAAGAGLVAAMVSATARGSSAALHGGWPQESTSPVASGPTAPAPLVELVGWRVAITHADGRVTSGRLLAVDADRLLVVTEPDDDVVELTLTDLARVRVLAPTDASASPPEIPDEPATTNRAPATMGAGVALTMAGAAAMWTYRAGAIVELLAETRYNGANPVSHRVEGWTSLAWPLAIVGGALLTVGLLMWTVAGETSRSQPGSLRAPLANAPRSARRPPVRVLTRASSPT